MNVLTEMIDSMQDPQNRHAAMVHLPIALASVTMPAPTKASTIRLTTELLCSAAVENAPTATARRGLPACRRRKRLNGRPAKRFSACSSECMPNKNRPSPATSRQRSNWFSITLILE